MSAVGELEAEGVFGVVGHFPAQQGDEVEAGRAVGLRRHLGRGWSILMPLAPPRSRALAAAQRHFVASDSWLFFLTEHIDAVYNGRVEMEVTECRYASLPS